jgi:hypothetical protein
VIRYPGAGAPLGRLFYTRAVMTETAPADVKIYHARDPRFPHDPTSDQLYKDERFEAYRALGESAARRALELSGRVLPRPSVDCPSAAPNSPLSSR